MPGFQIYLTTLNYPSEPWERVTRLNNFSNAQVTLTRSNVREAKVDINVYDPKLIKAVQKIRDIGRMDPVKDRGIPAYAHMLQIYWGGYLMFWGPITLPSWRYGSRTVTLNAVDPGVRLQFHQIVSGDKFQAGSKTVRDHNEVGVTADYRGLRELRDVAKNTAGQTARGVPDIGIANGTTGSTNSLQVKVRRGLEVMRSMQDIAEAASGKWFEFTPYDDVSGAYCKLDVHNDVAVDRTDQIALGAGCLGHNLVGFDWDPGGKIVTHPHVLSQDTNLVATIPHLDSSAYRGIYTSWEPIEYNGDQAMLDKYSEIVAGRYGRPIDAVQVTMKQPGELPFGSTVPSYLTDFNLGDTIRVACKAGAMNADLTGRIESVTVTQKAQDIAVQESITLRQPQETADALGTAGDSDA
jgi:hypothetical protein